MSILEAVWLFIGILLLLTIIYNILAWLYATWKYRFRRNLATQDDIKYLREENDRLYRAMMKANLL